MRGFREEKGSWNTICIAAAAAASGAGSAGSGRRRRTGRCRRSARSVAASSGRACSCPSRIRRPAPALRPGGSRRRRRSTALTVWSAAAEQPAADANSSCCRPRTSRIGPCLSSIAMVIVFTPPRSYRAPAEAAHQMVRLSLLQVRHRRVAAARFGVGAARVEGAARRHARRIGHVARNRHQRAPVRRPASSSRGTERSRPVGVGHQRVLQQRHDAAPLDDAARIHDHHPVGDLGHHAQVVGDEDHRHPGPACSSFSSSRICAWMVTSSAVVGSSAISTLGSQASAIAIITRWRIPPDSSCG